MGKASIILLYGTSTAGKTTICKELQKQDSEKSPLDRLHWVIDGQDLALDRMIEAATQFCINEIKKSKDSQPIFDEVQKVFTDVNIAKAIFFSNIMLGDQELSFMKDESIEVFRAHLDEIYVKISPQKQHLFSKNDMENIRALAIQHSEVFKKYHFLNPDEQEADMFNRAIENSKKGIPTIIDVVPGRDDSLIDRFFAHLIKSDYSCPTHIALVHCPLNVLTERMTERNKKAIENDSPEDIRDKTFPFHQYAQIFVIPKDEGQRIIGTVNREDIVNAVGKFSKELVKPASPSEADKIMDMLGFPKEGNDNEFRITAREYYDRMYNTEALSSTKEIAIKLTALATNKSELPSKPHPVVEAFKKDREKVKLKSIETRGKSNEDILAPFKKK